MKLIKLRNIDAYFSNEEQLIKQPFVEDSMVSEVVAFMISEGAITVDTSKSPPKDAEIYFNDPVIVKTSMEVNIISNREIEEILDIISAIDLRLGSGNKNQYTDKIRNILISK